MGGWWVGGWVVGGWVVGGWAAGRLAGGATAGSWLAGSAINLPLTPPTLHTRSLRARGSQLLVLRGSPQEVLPRVFKVCVWRGGGGREGGRAMCALLCASPPPLPASLPPSHPPTHHAGVGHHAPLL